MVKIYIVYWSIIHTEMIRWIMTGPQITQHARLLDLATIIIRLLYLGRKKCKDIDLCSNFFTYKIYISLRLSFSPYVDVGKLPNPINTCLFFVFSFYLFIISFLFVCFINNTCRTILARTNTNWLKSYRKLGAIRE